MKYQILISPLFSLILVGFANAQPENLNPDSFDLNLVENDKEYIATTFDLPLTFPRPGFCRKNVSCTSEESLQHYNLTAISFIASIENSTAEGRKEKDAGAQRRILQQIVGEFDQFLKTVKESDFSCILDRCQVTLEIYRRRLEHLQKWVKDESENKVVWKFVSLIQHRVRRAVILRCKHQ